MTDRAVYTIETTPEGLRHFNRLPEKVRDAAVDLIFTGLATSPRRTGKPLVGDPYGLWSARRGDYRVVYGIDDDTRSVLVHRVQHRRDVYRPR